MIFELTDLMVTSANDLTFFWLVYLHNDFFFKIINSQTEFDDTNF